MRKILFFYVTALLSVFGYTQPGANDPTFNTFDDGRYGNGSGLNPGASISAIAIQPDGKIVAGGNLTAYNGVPRNFIVRLNIDGGLDPTFDPGTGFDYTVATISIQADGKIIAGGDFTAFNGNPVMRVARLNADGSFDNTFNPGIGFTNNVITTAIQADGKILVGGQFTFTQNRRIARLNQDGTPDPTFHTGAGANDEVMSISVQPDGKIIVAGDFTQFQTTSPIRNRIVRLNADGTIDNSFNPGSGFNFPVFTTTLLPNGKIIAGGQFTEFNGTARGRIACLNADGSLDASFDPGSGCFGHVVSTSVQADGKIIAAGDLMSYNGTVVNRVMRVNPDGSLDQSFHAVNGPVNNIILATAVQTDGKILVGGGFYFDFDGTARNYLVRLNTDGSLDADFNHGTGFNKWVYATAVQSDGKIIVGGDFLAFNGAGRNRIVRLNPDGTLDATFNPGTGFEDDVRAIFIQADGKIIIGGHFTTFNGAPAGHIIRLNPDGSRDITFNPNAGFNGFIKSMAVQPDGKIILGGEFTGFNTISRNRIARLNADGTLDVTFNPGTGFNIVFNVVYAVAIQPDGKIIAGGSFSSYNGTTAVNNIARINANGTLDAAFNSGSGFSHEVRSLAVQPDGKIIIGGIFITFNGVSNSGIMRLNTNGTADLSFNAGTGLNATAETFAIQDDGKIIVGGYFTTFNGSSSNRIARINPDGSLDNGFNTGSAFNLPVVTIAIQPDGKIIAGGNFSSFNGIIKNRIIRILNVCPTISPSANISNVSCAGGSDGQINQAPGGGTAPYTFDWGGGITSEDRTGLAAGTYSVTISDANGCSTIFSTTITVPVSAISATATVTEASCFGGSDGEIDLTPSGGVIPYTFNWGTGITTEDITGLAAGTYSVIITDANGCTTISATVAQPVSAVNGSTSVINVSCSGNSDGEIDLTPGGGTGLYTFDWGGGITSQDRTGLIAGNYSVTITDANNCSVIVSASVTQPTPISSAFIETACNAYTWNTETYLTSGSYTQGFSAVNGCDSTVTLNLTINYPTTSLINKTSCDLFTLNGQTYHAGGIYIQHLTNAAGCDSTLTLNLIITHSTTNSITETACDSFTLNGQTYHTGGIYVQHLTNAVGCDSTLTLNLTITNATTSSITKTACNSFTLNDQTYTTSGTYIQHFTNNTGCDSTLTLHLTIKNSPTMSVLDNNDLSITASPADSYQWINCSAGTAIAGANAQIFMATENGTYAVIGISNDGCTDTSDCIIIDYLGLSEQSLMDITIAPNPTKNLVILQFEGSDVTLTIRDLQGKSLTSHQITSGDQIPLINYDDGIYLFEFATIKGIMTKRVVKN